MLTKQPKLQTNMFSLVSPKPLQNGSLSTITFVINFANFVGAGYESWMPLIQETKYLKNL